MDKIIKTVSFIALLLGSQPSFSAQDSTLGAPPDVTSNFSSGSSSGLSVDERIKKTDIPSLLAKMVDGGVTTTVKGYHWKFKWPYAYKYKGNSLVGKTKIGVYPIGSTDYRVRSSNWSIVVYQHTSMPLYFTDYYAPGYITEGDIYYGGTLYRWIK